MDDGYYQERLRNIEINIAAFNSEVFLNSYQEQYNVTPVLRNEEGGEFVVETQGQRYGVWFENAGEEETVEEVDQPVAVLLAQPFFAPRQDELDPVGLGMAEVVGD
jgi:hypothetical protein